MWKEFKNKWNNLFDEELEKTEKNTDHRQIRSFGHKTIESKISYQYPKNKHNQPKAIEPNTKKVQKTKEHNEERDKPFQERTQPFKASDVPSPVHGFRGYKQTEPSTIDRRDVPKEMGKEEPKANAPAQEVHTKAIQELQTEKVLENTHRALGTDEMPNENKQDESVSRSFDERETDLSNHQPERTIEAQPLSHQKLNKERSFSKKPINVMMTPRDKKVLADRQRNMPNRPNQMSNNIVKKVPLHLLNDASDHEEVNHEEWVRKQAEILQTTLRYFHIKAKVVGATQGPSVTRFEIQPEPGVKVSKIKNLSDDIKLNLAAKDIRMEAPIPGKNTIGIEVPNAKSEPVFLQRMLESKEFQDQPSPLTVALGADIEGNAVVTDLQKMPHGLIAGATGSGKSVCINTILISMLYKANHEEVKFLLIDPKMVELTPYNEIPHLVAPVITDVKAATSSLKWAVSEMENRYQLFVEERVRDLTRYNEKMVQQNRTTEKLPYIVIVIDELADLMMTSPQDVEDAICRIAQKARACGIHLLIATQRPSVDVITGLIKANIPTRIAFSVSSQVDSRTILDVAGAEKLLGKGDMLFIENGSGEIRRIQGAFVSDEEIERITHYVKQMASPNYLFEQEQLIQQIDSSEERDELYSEAIEFVLDHNGASASLLQRRFKIGYNRAARLIDSLEQDGIISGQNGSKPREVLVSKSEIFEQ